MGCTHLIILFVLFFSVKMGPHITLKVFMLFAFSLSIIFCSFFIPRMYPHLSLLFVLLFFFVRCFHLPLSKSFVSSFFFQDVSTYLYVNLLFFPPHHQSSIINHIFFIPKLFSTGCFTPNDT